MQRELLLLIAESAKKQDWNPVPCPHQPLVALVMIKKQFNAFCLSLLPWLGPLVLAPADSKTGFSKWPIWGGFLPRRPPWDLARREPGLGGPGKAHIRVVNEGQGQKIFMKGF